MNLTYKDMGKLSKVEILDLSCMLTNAIIAIRFKVNLQEKHFWLKNEIP